ncbi:MAG TPA: hypothetical protein VK926_04225 [Gaiellaceae bacterium]|nr:hypothetical protein [Gaiellaceae bacterium]
MNEDATNVWAEVPDWGGVGRPTARACARRSARRLGLGGPAGGHQARNDGDEPARVLLVSTNADPDVAEYPESGKVATVTGGEQRFYRTGDAVEHAGSE